MEDINRQHWELKHALFEQIFVIRFDMPSAETVTGADKIDKPPLPATSAAKTPTDAGLLLEQYKLLEERRKFFGNQFMQTTGGVAAVFTVLFGLLGGKPEAKPLLGPAFFTGGIAFVLLAYLNYRLSKRQDHCEKVMADIESSLRLMGYLNVATMPSATERFGARKAIILFQLFLGAALVVAALYRKWN